ncbi:hypothetical protein NEF87_004155 [Candidatus Lokiarchaeum ossiferum]|uniref:5'-deoxynucleotidase n=1 Tax=Candidatus Lokiarchaeum ossiferum TaxID=2951803 RepID=A0ABY6HWS6_9ARCH|nr:hypothetical protein NEF87_004155 [Candidatus Lokiarchaeum sp. B-35]
MVIEKGNNPFDLFEVFQEAFPGEISSIFKVYLQFNHLKRVYRKGWLKSGISPQICESDADHSLGVAFLGLILAQKYAPSLNQAKLLKMAIIHELGETVVGDITPDEDYPTRKQEEFSVVQKILHDLPNSRELVGLYSEFENKSSPEGKFMKEIDSLEMVFQALIYEKEFNFDSIQFLESVQKKIMNPHLKTVFEQIKKIKKLES